MESLFLSCIMTLFSNRRLNRQQYQERTLASDLYKLIVGHIRTANSAQKATWQFGQTDASAATMIINNFLCYDDVPILHTINALSRLLLCDQLVSLGANGSLQLQRGFSDTGAARFNTSLAEYVRACFAFVCPLC